MSAPVDTDALRDRAIEDEALGYPLSAAVQRAAADELDRLREIIDTINTTYDVDKMLRTIKAGE